MICMKQKGIMVPHSSVASVVLNLESLTPGSFFSHIYVQFRKKMFPGITQCLVHNEAQLNQNPP